MGKFFYKLKPKQNLLFMEEAIKEAKKSLKTNDIPIGAVAVKDRKIIAKAHNQKEKFHDATNHAEILCIKKASKKLKSWRLHTVEIYSTLEPCPMCAGALIQARVKSIYYLLEDPKSGAAKSVLKITNNKKLNHRAKTEKIRDTRLKDEYLAILKGFFKKLREPK